MQDDDDAVGALLAALQADSADGPAPGVWEEALAAAFAAEPGAAPADLVPVMDDDAVLVDEDELVLTDDDPATEVTAGNDAAGAADDPDDPDLDGGPAAEEPFTTADDAAADADIDLGEPDNLDGDSGW
ncbi:hypothetical protein ACFWPA_02425 [Rhodococcus sp. NPDC058505]|uniref:hypothetical protein n=1 Tax=unclassified Rhodococcus (in: high G+C Gram-positive bacteria) TaxID=192944 RepID=UPI0036600108